MDIGREPQHILEMYGAEPGKPSFANTCLLARRLLERGVRFVADLPRGVGPARQPGQRPQEELQGHRPGVRRARSRTSSSAGMLDDTLVVWGGEFGRTPMVQGGATTAATIIPTPSRCGWPAAASSRASPTARPTSSASSVVKDKVHVHDLHATMLHLLGFDHTRLTYRFQGRDFRLTDVFGQVVKGHCIA